MHKAVILWAVLISLPIITGALLHLLDWELLPVFIETIYFLPISWLGKPFFIYISDIGAYITTDLGRVMGTIIYSCLYWICYLSVRRFKKTS